jgi:hypothetical protein
VRERLRRRWWVPRGLMCCVGRRLWQGPGVVGTKEQSESEYCAGERVAAQEMSCRQEKVGARGTHWE